MNPGAAPKAALTPTQWLICFIASIGFAFDIYELLMGPLVFPPAIEELTGARRGSPEFQVWVGRLFYIPAFAGGIFGLLGGYLTDRLGRRRVLTWSILVYAFGAFAAGFSTNIQMLLFFRCLVFVGVCVEFVAAVAWLAELFPDPKRREKVLGYTQAFSSVGGLLVAVANGLCVKYALTLPGVGLPDWLNLFGGEIKDHHAPWRYTLMTGLIPAIPLIFIRPFLPESPAWARKRAEGTLKRPSFAALFAPELRQTTLVTTLMFACAYGAAFGAIQQIPQIVPGLPDVRAQVKARLETDEVKQKVEKRLADPEVQAKLGGMTEEAEKRKYLAAERARIERPEAARIQQGVASSVTKVQEIGGLAGRFTLAALAVYIVSRRKLLRLFQVPGLIVMPVVFAYCAVTGLNVLYAGIFLAGFLTVAQFSFWGNYLPRVYPVHLRGTGESFAANIGGRLIGTSFAWVTATLATTTDITRAPMRLAYTAAGIAFGVYLVGFLLSFALPEPKHEELPE